VVQKCQDFIGGDFTKGSLTKSIETFLRKDSLNIQTKKVDPIAGYER
jgi:hypothetical protein